MSMPALSKSLMALNETEGDNLDSLDCALSYLEMFLSLDDESCSLSVPRTIQATDFLGLIAILIICYVGAFSVIIMFFLLAFIVALPVIITSFVMTSVMNLGNFTALGGKRLNLRAKAIDENSLTTDEKSLIGFF